MDIAEIKEKKNALEDVLLDLVCAFEKETGVNVDSVRFTEALSIESMMRLKSSVQVKVSVQ